MRQNAVLCGNGLILFDALCLSQPFDIHTHALKSDPEEEEFLNHGAAKAENTANQHFLLSPQIFFHPFKSNTCIVTSVPIILLPQ